MLVSHGCKFILFSDPLDSCPWIERALAPLLDQPIAVSKRNASDNYFFRGMSPAEAELAFDMSGLAFRGYMRIAVIQNPFTKMQQLYQRIAETDRVWLMRERMGLGAPDYVRWLRSTRPDGLGAGHRGSPRWRRFGAWSARAWCGNRITHFVRAEHAARDLGAIFEKFGITTDISGRIGDPGNAHPLQFDQSTQVNELIYDRYHWDMQFYQPARSNLRLVA